VGAGEPVKELVAGFGAPPDTVAWAALATGIALVAWNLWRPGAPLDSRLSDRVFVAVLAALAALLSAGYVAFYLRGGPRIIDATSYYLEARAFSEGLVRIPLAPFPSAAFRGRFLLGAEDGSAVSVIFPPGYPAVLALGFLAGAPMAVGPLLAAGLVVASFALARRVFDDAAVARLAAVLSTVCAVLRYHTADTMSHGLAALLLAAALWAANGDSRREAFLAGSASGLLVATRPVTGLLCIVLVLYGNRRVDRAMLALAGAATPVVAFFLEQRAATGSWFTSSQSAYYALADGPPGCFRYGFGSGIGCTFEHGDFVRAHLRNGYGFVAALGTTLRRLKMHLADAGNGELFAPVLVYALVRSIREKKANVLAFGVCGIICAYAPFYFDGNYPGGGARFFADVLPLEHGLVAWALVRVGISRFAVALALIGFAVHTSRDHRQLAEREGGRPMFERELVADRGVERGLVFVSTDHGFNLGFDPRSLDRAGSLVVARRRYDAHDALLWDALGRPDVYEYSYEPSSSRGGELVRIALDTTLETARFEAESQWPSLAVAGGAVIPTFRPCASRGRALLLAPSGSGEKVTTRLEVPRMPRQTRRVDVGWVVPPGGAGVLVVTLGPTKFVADTATMSGCAVTEGPRVALGEREFLEVSAGSEVGVDFFELRAP
jgi:hypothetical protein